MAEATLSWWRGRSEREREALIFGAVAALLLSVYALVWAPLEDALARLRTQVSAQHTELAWLRDARARLELLRRRAEESGADRGQTQTPSLPTLVDSSARAAGLGERLLQVEPRPERRVSVRFEQVGFDALLRWLALLAERHAIAIDSAVLEPHAVSGRVDARLVLRAGPAG